MEVIILRRAIHDQLLANSCIKIFFICNAEMNSADFSFLSKFVSGNEIVIRQSSQKSLILLSRLLFNITLGEIL
jgi:hypothetical protein